jgi:hypothetical protein
LRNHPEYQGHLRFEVERRVREHNSP